MGASKGVLGVGCPLVEVLGGGYEWLDAWLRALDASESTLVDGGRSLSLAERSAAPSIISSIKMSARQRSSSAVARAACCPAPFVGESFVGEPFGLEDGTDWAGVEGWLG